MVMKLKLCKIEAVCVLGNSKKTQARLTDKQTSEFRMAGLGCLLVGLTENKGFLEVSFTSFR